MPLRSSKFQLMCDRVHTHIQKLNVKCSECNCKNQLFHKSWKKEKIHQAGDCLIRSTISFMKKELGISRLWITKEKEENKMESRILDWSKQHVIYFKSKSLMRISERLTRWYSASKFISSAFVVVVFFNDNATFCGIPLSVLCVHWHWLRILLSRWIANMLKKRLCYLRLWPEIGCDKSNVKYYPWLILLRNL